MRAPSLQHCAAALCLTVALGPAVAQVPSCSCDTTATRTANRDVLAALLAGRMACAAVGNEQWQEWHNGSVLAGGEVVDYKMGPGHAVDPSKPVGTYLVTDNNTVRYTYSPSAIYEYQVCAAVGGNYTFCAVSSGGRNITGVKVGGSALQSCASVSSVALPSTAAKLRPAKGPAPTPPVKPPAPVKK